MKRYLTFPPLLSKPVTGKTLFFYLAASESAVSGDLVREDEGIQKSVYCQRVADQSPNQVSNDEKLVLALFVTSRKLRHYFQFFPITVLTEHPLRSINENSKATGRIAK